MDETRLDMEWGTRLSAELRAALLPQAQQDGAAGVMGTRSRRDFFRAAGVLGATGVAASLVGCAGDGPTAAAIATGPASNHAPAGTVVLDFSTDIGVLNYAYALEQLEAAFYIQVVNTPNFTTRFAPNEQRVLMDLRDHEVAHREFLQTALGTAHIGALTPNFSGIDFTSRMSVLETARTFEDLGVAAYNGAGKYLRSAAFLTVAGKIVSVEARHAAAIRAVLNGNRTPAFAPNAFDPALAPATVLGQADPFIVQNITVINA